MHLLFVAVISTVYKRWGWRPIAVLAAFTVAQGIYAIFIY